MYSGTKTGWLSAAVAVLVSASWAAAQSPVNPAIDNSDYFRPASPTPKAVATVPGSPRPTASDVTPAGLTFDTPPGLPGDAHGVPPAAPWPGNPFADLPESGPPPYRVWGSADFLAWKINGATLPSLAFSVPIGVVQVKTQDQLVNAFTGATTTFGPPVEHFFPISVQSNPTLANGEDLNFDEQLGGRFTAGIWLDAEGSLGIESTFFFLPRQTLGFNGTTGNFPDQSLINLPVGNSIFIFTPSTVTSTTITNPPNPTVTTTTVNPPQTTFSQTVTASVVRQVSASLTGSASTEMWGGELNARCTSPSLGAVSGLVGFRYLNFQEDLNLNNSIHLFLPPGFADTNVTGLPADLSLGTTDSIRTHNDFYGGQVGLDLDMFVGRFIMDLQGKVALGVMHQTVNVFSASTLPDGTTASGGLLSSPGDEGSHSRNSISAIPEVNVKLGYMLTPSVRAYVGYDFLYVANVARPGDQTGIASSGVTATVAGSTSQIAVSQPTFRFNETDVWVQGINFGVEVRY